MSGLPPEFAKVCRLALDGTPLSALRDYQIEGAYFLAQAKRAVLADDPGLGKTATALLASRYSSPPRATKLIVCPKVAASVWQDEIEKWLGEPSTIFMGHPIARERAWERFTDGQGEGGGGRFLITNYALLKDVVARGWKFDLVIMDECHVLRNRQTQLFKLIRSSLKPRLLFLLTGTPIINSPADMWTLLHLSDPTRWSSYWAFCNTWLATAPGDHGGMTVLGPKDVGALRRAIAPYLLRRTKKEVLTELPDKVRQAYHMWMTPVQQKMYDQICDELLLELPNGNLMAVPNAVARITRLRQLLVSPRLLGVDEDGAALEALIEMVKEQYDQKRPVAVFTPFRAGAELIAERLRPLSSLVVTVMGGMEPGDIQETYRKFQQSKDPRKAYVSTIKSGVAVTVTEAKTAYFLQYEWAPTHNFQAEDRLHRLGQKDTVHAVYFVHRDTVDEHVVDVLEQKKSWSDLVLEPRKLLRPSKETV